MPQKKITLPNGKIQIRDSETDEILWEGYPENQNPKEAEKFTKSADKAPKFKKKHFYIILTFIFFAAVIYMISSPTPKVSNSALDGSVRQVVQYLNETLNDPNSYESIEWSPVTDFEQSSNDSYRYMVRHKYRATNPLGFKIINNQLFYLNQNGKVVDVKDFNE